MHILPSVFRTSLSSAIAVWAVLVGGPSSFAQILRQIDDVEYVFALDRSVSYMIHREITPLTQSAVQTSSQMRLTVNGNQTLDVLEAYTRKSDGRRIDVSESEIVTQDGAVGPSISYVDIKVRQIPFKEVAVGDTIVVKLRYSEKDHYIPGEYSSSYAVLASGGELVADIKVRRPASLPFQHRAHLFAHEETRTSETVAHRWTGKFHVPAITEQNIADLAFRLPRVDFSTFESNESIAKAYFRGAEKMLEVTPAIQKLADEITVGKSDSRAQAVAIFDWVTRNVRYLAVFFGNGRYVPNAPETVIARRYGDCKDLSTLMGALLAAKGIGSEYVLINTNPAYQLLSTPLVGSFNHVIVYLPQFDAYADPAAPYSLIGHLPPRDEGKPVVHVSKNGAVEARTPIGTSEDNVARISSRLRVGPDGIVEGQTAVDGSGVFAQLLRQFAAQSEGKSAQVALDALGKQVHILGQYSLETPPATTRSEPYRIKTSWTSDRPLELLDKCLQVPPGLSPVTLNMVHLFGPVTAGRVNPAVCRPGRMIQEVIVELPQRIVPKSLPKPLRYSKPPFDFSKEWSFTGNTLIVRSELSSATNSAVCSPDVINAIAAVAEELRDKFSPTLRFVRQDDSKQNE